MALRRALAKIASRAHGARLLSGFGGGSPTRVYGRFTIFKGKAALDVGPIPPTFKAAGVDAAAVERPGVLLLGFTPAEGERGYAWGNKQLFSMTVLTATLLYLKVDPHSSLSFRFWHEVSLVASSYRCFCASA